MAMSGGKDDGSPMMEMNTTPLIDVMLVLLIMFIITIPVATHAVNVDLPTPSNNPPNDIHPDKNKVTILANDVVQWNGAPVDQAQLETDLQATMKLNPQPELQFEPDPQAGYQTAAVVLKTIKGTGVTKFGFVHNELYASFNRAANSPAPSAK